MKKNGVPLKAIPVVKFMQPLEFGCYGFSCYIMAIRKNWANPVHPGTKGSKGCTVSTVITYLLVPETSDACPGKAALQGLEQQLFLPGEAEFLTFNTDLHIIKPPWVMMQVTLPLLANYWPSCFVRCCSFVKLNVWPPILASYIKPPFVMVKVAIPLL